MNGCPRGADCGGCQMYGGPVVCRCLGITEDELVTALTTLQIRTVQEVRRVTGAGDGCTACHSRIQSYIQTYSSSSSLEICSAR